MENPSSDSKKDLILQTTREILAKFGFAKMTLDDVANALGMKKSSLYYYYDNKDALLEDVIKYERENFCLIIQEALSAAGSTMDKIINYEKAKFNYVQSTLKMHEITISVFHEIKRKLLNEIQIIHQKEREMLKKNLDEGVQKGEIKKCDTRRIAWLLVTLSEALRHREFYFASFHVGSTIDFSKAVDEMIFAIKLMFDGLAVD